ncbi:MAG: DUF3336 domain-containing protein [Leptospiraceae bacterium]|nr:DUF3336 domain-containing protein [Leptospiraceae bacterium]MCP5493461.1 DUF3336 domain-containing protein [Leptospiraceae bacterium]
MMANERPKTYQEWLKQAEDLDRKEGKLQWRQDDRSDLYHSILIREHLEIMRKLRQANEAKKLIDVILESLSRHSYELNNPQLYSQARSGTKYLIGDYLQEIETSINYICETEIENFSDNDKLQLFTEGNRVHGKTVLILSGGAALGIYHIGVTKALHDEKLLPSIISGASMGSVVAAAVCTRTDKELHTLFSDLDQLHKVAIRMYPLWDMLRKGGIMDPEQLKEHIYNNVLDLTFLEAYQKTGRVLNISVSATRKRQKPKVLNYLSAPNVLIRNSALASCAIPGIFPPVSLQAKNQQGEVVPYMESEKWIDGSVHLDVPMRRIMRLHNVSRSIVSQANPHVLPFVPEQNHGGFWYFLSDLAFSTIQFQALKFMDVALRLSEKMPWLSIVDKIRALMEQEYRGDINISYPMDIKAFTQLMANPDPNEFEDYIRKGQLATWPKIAFIKDQLRLNQILESCIAKLQRTKKGNAKTNKVYSIFERSNYSI